MGEEKRRGEGLKCSDLNIRERTSHPSFVCEMGSTCYVNKATSRFKQTEEGAAAERVAGQRQLQSCEGDV